MPPLYIFSNILTIVCFKGWHFYTLPTLIHGYHTKSEKLEDFYLNHKIISLVIREGYEGGNIAEKLHVHNPHAS